MLLNARGGIQRTLTLGGERTQQRVKIPGIAGHLAQPTVWLSDPLIAVVTVPSPSPGVAGKSLTLIQRSALGPRVTLRLAQGYH